MLCQEADLIKGRVHLRPKFSMFFMRYLKIVSKVL